MCPNVCVSTSICFSCAFSLAMFFRFFVLSYQVCLSLFYFSSFFLDACLFSMRGSKKRCRFGRVER